MSLTLSVMVNGEVRLEKDQALVSYQVNLKVEVPYTGTGLFDSSPANTKTSDVLSSHTQQTTNSHILSSHASVFPPGCKWIVQFETKKHHWCGIQSVLPQTDCISNHLPSVFSLLRTVVVSTSQQPLLQYFHFHGSHIHR